MKTSLIALSLASAPLLAGEMDQQHSYNSSCCEPSCCSPCGSPPAPPCVNCECYTPQFYNLQCAWGGFVYVDFLYWYGKDTGLTIGQTLDVSVQNIGIGNPIATLGQTNTIYFDDSWDPGVRVGIGFNSCNDGWDLNLNWTYYKTSRTEKLLEKENTFYINSWMTPAYGFLARSETQGTSQNFVPLNTSTQAKYRNRINQIDLEIGRKSWLSQCVTVRPFMGIRGAWERAHLQVSGQVPNSFVIPVEGNFDETTLRTRGWGVGVMGGLEPDWHFGCGFSLYGRVGAALLWGDLEIKRTEVVTTSDGTTIDVPNYEDDFSTMLPIIDLALGLKWERAYCEQRYMTALSIGWEHHIWFDRNHRPLYGDVDGILVGSTPVEGTAGFFVNNDTIMQGGNFAFGGLVIRARFDF